jgi:hypothetical protein
VTTTTAVLLPQELQIPIVLSDEESGLVAGGTGNIGGPPIGGPGPIGAALGAIAVGSVALYSR